MKIYLCIGIVVSIQCFVLFWLVWFGLAKGEYVYYESFGGTKFSFGILGFGDAINYFGSAAFLRTASFFYEPTKLGAFLILPICWSYAQYKKLKKKRYLAYLLLMGFNFMATFSRACFLSFAISCVCVRLFRAKSDKINTRVSAYKKFRAAMRIACCAIFFLFLGSLLYRFAQGEEELYATSAAFENNAIAGMVNRSSTVESRYGNAFVRNDSSFGEIFERVRQEPFGHGLGWTGRAQEFNNPSALGMWVYSGGILAFMVLVILYGQLFFHYYLECMHSGDIQMKVFGVGFLAVTIQNMSYGSWLDSLYMLIVALMILAVERKESIVLSAHV